MADLWKITKYNTCFFFCQFKHLNIKRSITCVAFTSVYTQDASPKDRRQMELCYSKFPITYEK